jgi:Fe-S cluster assembly protein SufB
MTTAEQLKDLTEQKYRYGFVTDIEADAIPKGLSEEIIRIISRKKGEPQFMLDWRLKAYRHWLTMQEPDWANVTYKRPDYQQIVYYSAPRQKKGPSSMEEVDPELKRAFSKLGIPLEEQMRLAGIAVDAVFDSVSVATSAPWSPPPTTSSRRSTARSSPTAASSTCPRACAAPWSCPPTSASTPRTPASSSGR